MVEDNERLQKSKLQKFASFPTFFFRAEDRAK